MAKIQISENESLREAIRRFKKMCDKEGIINQSKRYAKHKEGPESKCKYYLTRNICSLSVIRRNNFVAS